MINPFVWGSFLGQIHTNLHQGIAPGKGKRHDAV